MPTPRHDETPDGSSAGRSRVVARFLFLTVALGAVGAGALALRGVQADAAAARAIARDARDIALAATHQVRELRRLEGLIDEDGRALPAEVAALRRKYGQKKYSWHDEELFIREFFKDQRDGYFVDVGAYDYKQNSNTYYLEEHLGWRGIAIDADEQHRAGYLRFRPKTKYFTFFVSDRSDVIEDFYVTPDATQSTGDKALATYQAGRKGGRFLQKKVRSITLDALLEREGVKQIDFLTMDIELGEPAALAGFTIKKYRPRLVCIEMWQPVEKQLAEYFARNDYVKIPVYSRLDPANNYYRPRQDP